MILADTGPLVAIADAADANHSVCVGYFERLEGPVLVPVSVAVEVCYLLGWNLGPRAEVAFLRAFPGELTLQQLTVADLARTADLVEQYGDFPPGMVDASVVAVAERLGLRTIATTDHRHFRAVRPRHLSAFELAP